MKYYCPDCEAEITIPEKIPVNEGCPLCDSGLFASIPDFENPEQYEARTQKSWPEDGPVWSISDDEEPQWRLMSYAEAMEISEVNDTWIVCVQGPKAPPDDWRIE